MNYKQLAIFLVLAGAKTPVNGMVLDIGDGYANKPATVSITHLHHIRYAFTLYPLTAHILHIHILLMQTMKDMVASKVPIDPSIRRVSVTSGTALSVAKMELEDKSSRKSTPTTSFSPNSYNRKLQACANYEKEEGCVASADDDTNDCSWRDEYTNITIGEKICGTTSTYGEAGLDLDVFVFTSPEGGENVHIILTVLGNSFPAFLGFYKVLSVSGVFPCGGSVTAVAQSTETSPGIHEMTVLDLDAGTYRIGVRPIVGANGLECSSGTDYSYELMMAVSLFDFVTQLSIYHLILQTQTLSIYRHSCHHVQRILSLPMAVTSRLLSMLTPLTHHVLMTQILYALLRRHMVV